METFQSNNTDLYVPGTKKAKLDEFDQSLSDQLLYEVTQRRRFSP